MPDRQWFVHGVQIFETGEEEYFAGGVQFSEDQAEAGTIDTRAKRSSAMEFSLGLGLHTLPPADASIDGPDKQHLLGMYSAIPFDVAAGGTFTNYYYEHYLAGIA